MKPLINYIREPQLLIIALLRDYGSWIPDRLYLQMQYRLNTGSRLNLDNPQVYGEKIQWLKLYNRRPEYTMMVEV